MAEHRGWLALLGGGEFSFGETEEADQAWIERTPPGPGGFIPAAWGSNDYPRHFAEYLKEEFDREVEIIPIYRERDGRRGRNAERIRDVAAVYIGGGGGGAPPGARPAPPPPPGAGRRRPPGG